MQKGVFDLQPPIFGVFELILNLLVFLVDGHQKLELFVLLHQELFVLVQELLVGRESAGVLADSFV